MNIKFSFSSMLIDTPFKQDVNLLNDFLQNYIKDISNIKKIDDWTMIICISYTSIKNHGPFLWIFKNSRTYKNDKEKEFTIQLPLPSIEDKSWGLTKKQITSQQPFNEKYFNKVEIDIEKYDNLYDYQNQLIMIGIDELFKNGFTFNGVKIKK